MLVAARTRGWLYDLFTHNYAEQLRITREVQRKKLGLTQQDLPYPGSITGNTVHITRPAPMPPAVAPCPVTHTPGKVVIVEQQQPDGSWVTLHKTVIS